MRHLDRPPWGGRDQDARPQVPGNRDRPLQKGGLGPPFFCVPSRGPMDKNRITRLISPTEEGAPQGGPLSPLLSNLMLDVLDKLEKRGHRFVRYADDCNIYVRSQRAGERVMESIEQFLAKRLKLRVNKA